MEQLLLLTFGGRARLGATADTSTANLGGQSTDEVFVLVGPRVLAVEHAFVVVVVAAVVVIIIVIVVVVFRLGILAGHLAAFLVVVVFEDDAELLGQILVFLIFVSSTAFRSLLRCANLLISIDRVTLVGVSIIIAVVLALSEPLLNLVHVNLILDIAKA